MPAIDHEREFRMQLRHQIADDLLREPARNVPLPEIRTLLHGIGWCVLPAEAVQVALTALAAARDGRPLPLDADEIKRAFAALKDARP